MPAKIDLAGKQFGKLTVIKELENGKLQVICECGTIEVRMRESMQASINKGYMPSCRRCKVRILKPRDHHIGVDIAGQRFGKLTAIEATYRVNKRRYMIWRFRCDCGAVIERIASNVISMSKRGFSPNCGRKECNGHPKYPKGLAAKVERMNSYRRNAAVRDIDYKLTLEQALTLFDGNCHYCGAPPSSILRARNGQYGDAIVNGIDRIDNTQGYVPGNVVSCCFKCNHAKGTMTYQDFMDWIARITVYRKNLDAERK